MVNNPRKEEFSARNRGTHAEGSMVGSLEFATGALKSRLILVPHFACRCAMVLAVECRVGR